MSWKFILDLLPWILPPLVGAVIGFVTNYLAIRMIFRPLTQKKIFGIPIPFTPGIIPRQRHVLAESIGKMVSNSLITSDAIQNHLDLPQTREMVQRQIADLTGYLIQSPLNFLNKDILETIQNFLQSFLEKSLKHLFDSQDFIEGSRDLLDKIITNISKRQLHEVLQALKADQFIDKTLLPFLESEKIKTPLEAQIKIWIRSQMDQNTSLHSLIPVTLVEDLFRLFQSVLPQLLESLFNWLRNQETKENLGIHGKELLKAILNKLNTFQKFFISVGQYDKTLETQMPSIIEDTITQLEKAATDKTNQSKFSKALQKGITSWLDKGIFDIFYTQGIDIESRTQEIFEKIYSFINNQETRGSLLKGIEGFLENNKDLELAEILEERLGLDREKLTSFLHNALMGLAQKDSTPSLLAKQLADILSKIMNSLKERSIQDVFGIEESVKEKLDSLLFQQFYILINKRLPDVVASLEIKEMVVNKVNSLSLPMVEKLLLDVMERHLKWINVFGAILGALIGFIQVVLNRFLS
ncbi:MAG: DUF445 family protein [Spirochaetales bacterium]|nr:DUF445 family protein [Spirochaetales bacterium]